jgi:hypothetical protein
MRLSNIHCKRISYLKIVRKWTTRLIENSESNTLLNRSMSTEMPVIPCSSAIVSQSLASIADSGSTYCRGLSSSETCGT